MLTHEAHQAHAMKCDSTAAVSWKCDNMRCIKKMWKQKKQMCLEKVWWWCIKSQWACRRSNAVTPATADDMSRSSDRSPRGGWNWTGRKSCWQLDRDPSKAQGVKSHIHSSAVTAVAHHLCSTSYNPRCKISTPPRLIHKQTERERERMIEW